MSKQHRTSTVRALSLAAFAALPSLAARGQTSTWVANNGGGNWNVAANWDTNAVPGTGTARILVFGGSGTDSYVATQNVINPFTLNQIQITTTSSNPIVIGGTTTQTAANTIAFNGAGAAVIHSGTGDAYLNGPLTLTGATEFNVQNAATNLYILGDFAASAVALTKTGAGTMVWGTPDPVTVSTGGGNTVTLPARGITVNLTGAVNVNQGTLLIGNTGGSFLTNSQIVTIASGATFDFHNNAEDFGSLAGGGTLIANGAGINLGFDNRSTTWSGNIINGDPTKTLSKQGTGTWTITSSQQSQARMLVAGGTLVLSGGGAINNASEVEIGAGGTLKLDNTGGTVGRLNNENTLIMNGNSELVFAGDTASDSQEGVGAVIVRGLSTITMLPGAGRNARLDLGAVLQEPGGTGAADSGMVLFRGNKLGATPGADTSNVFLFYNPSMIGGNGGAGTTNQPILPYALSDTSATGSGNSLVTYDVNTGVRGLNTATEFAPYASANPTDNVRVTAAASGLAGKTVNSLVVDNSSGTAFTVGGTAGQTVNVTSGAVLFSGSAAVTLSGFDALNFDANVGYISSANSATAGATIAMPITGSNGIVKGGAGVLALTAANTYTGGTIVSAGTLKVAADNNLGATSNSVAFNGGTLQIGADLGSDRQFTVNTGGVGTVDTQAFKLTLSKIPNGTGTLVKAGTGMLVIPEIGGTNLGTINMSGGTLRVTKNNSTGTNARDFVLVGTLNTIDTNGFDATMGNVSGTGGMTKTGLGTLLMQGTNTFDGDININQGIVKIIGTGGSFYGDLTYTNIAAGATLDMSDNSEQWGGISGAGTIVTGTVTNVDVNMVGARTTTFSGSIQGAGDFAKNGTGNLTVSGPSTYTGATDVNSGTLIVNANVLPSQPGPLGQSTNTIGVANTSGSTTVTMLIGQSGVEIGRNINVRSGSSGVATLGSNHTTGTSTFSGNIAMAKAVTFTAAAGGQTDLTGILSGAGALNKTGAGTIRLTRVNTYTGATTVSAGTLRIDGSATNSASLTVNNTGTFQAGATQTLKSLVVNAGGKANIVGANAVLTAKALSINATGRMDLGTGTLVYDYTSPATTPAAAEALVRTALIAGRGTGDWAGANGITSSAITGSTRAMGYAQASTLVGAAGGTFNGIALDADAVVVKMTVAGDSSLDGLVNFADLLTLARNYNSTTAVWSTGDFDYNGNVNFNDLLILARNYNGVLGAPTPAELAGTSAEFQADAAAAFAAAVPEPSSAAFVLAASGLAMAGRRRRRGC